VIHGLRSNIVRNRCDVNDDSEGESDDSKSHQARFLTECYQTEMSELASISITLIESVSWCFSDGSKPVA